MYIVDLLVYIFFYFLVFPSVCIESAYAIEILSNDRSNDLVISLTIVFFSYYFLWLQFTMTSHANKLVDPSLCTCLPGSYRHAIFSNVKWSTLSIVTALLIIVRTSLLSTYSYIHICVHIDCLPEQWLICSDWYNNNVIGESVHRWW